MYRGTTPTLQLMLVADDLDFSSIVGIWVTLKSSCVTLTFHGDEVSLDPEEGKVYVTLTQEQTLSFGTGKVKIQARVLMEDGTAYATDVAESDVQNVLMEGVVEIEDDPTEDPGEGSENPPEGAGGDEDPEGPGGELQQPDGEA